MSTNESTEQQNNSNNIDTITTNGSTTMQVDNANIASERKIPSSGSDSANDKRNIDEVYNEQKVDAKRVKLGNDGSVGVVVVGGNGYDDGTKTKTTPIDTTTTGDNSSNNSSNLDKNSNIDAKVTNPTSDGTRLQTAPTATSVPTLTVTTVAAPVAASVPTQTPNPVAAPVVASVPAQSPNPVPAPVAASIPAPAATPVPAPVATPFPAQTLNPVPASAAASMPTPTAASIPAPVAASMPAPAAASIPARALVPAQVATSVPTSTADSVPTGTSMSAVAKSNPISDQKIVVTIKKQEEIVSKYIRLYQLPSNIKPLEPLNKSELKELEMCLGINKTNETWRDDWLGNLAFADEDIPSPDSKSKGPKKSLLQWAARGKNAMRSLNYLLRFVYHVPGTPQPAKDILACTLPDSVESIQYAIRRVSYDPVVLREDGWTTAKSAKPIGASGGPYQIGEMVRWEGYDGVVIAYIHDKDLGDLWKAMWLEECDTFDLEAEELDSAKKKYQRKAKPKDALGTESGDKGNTLKSTSTSTSASTPASNRSSRFASIADFTVEGIEHGIVQATSYSRGSRPGVFWPARVVHASEMKKYSPANKRGSQRQKIDVVFLAPYWNAPTINVNTRRVSATIAANVSKHGTNVFETGPLLEMENIDVSEEHIQQYPYSIGSGLDMDKLRVSFRFTGLPQAAFPRFVQSHRLALALKTYSHTYLKSTTNELDKTTAGLFESHPLSVQTALYPASVLHLPFGHILDQLPRPSVSPETPEQSTEPTLQLGAMLDAMKPPLCWGQSQENSDDSVKSNSKAEVTHTTVTQSPIFQPQSKPDPSHPVISVDHFVKGFKSLSGVIGDSKETTLATLLISNLEMLLSNVHHDQPGPDESNESRSKKMKELIKKWALMKMQGEELIMSSLASSDLVDNSAAVDWRRVCERVFQHIGQVFSTDKFGDKVSAVLTDSLCNQHLTPSGCFERAVRLPAAVKAAKEAGAGSTDNILLVTSIDQHYLDYAENKVIEKAHNKAYLKRIKKRCLAMPTNEKIVSLTEDSDGNGGEDTKGSRGSWMAAIVGVGAVVKAVDMITQGECVNVFCVTRPPGHHAGRELHPMKAVSNGFCILNPAACAALYATTPLSEGGPGFRRVCVIDIDVHHGNGTQDILCSTYDPRFLYVSIHAGGAHVNGIETADDSDQLSHHLGNTKKGIYPGRCGDTSPHNGVLNIPLGVKVTAHALGTALVTKVTPAVEEFAPDLIVMSTGFDAHKHDPLGLGGLNAEDFGTLTEVICQLAHKLCSGRVVSVLEGGYGVPCCRPQENLFLPPENEVPSTGNGAPSSTTATAAAATVAGGGINGDTPNPSEPTAAPKSSKVEPAMKEFEILDLGEEIPSYMTDTVPYPLQKRLDKCHAEGFMQCVREHVRTLAKCNNRR